MPDDGPSFLTTPPVTAPEPEQRGQIVLPPSSPYREPGAVPPPRARARIVPRPDAEKPAVHIVIPIGDRAGEHLAIEHGKYDAWLHVVVGFVLEVALLGALPYWVLAHISPAVGLGAGVVVGGAAAIWVFHDRWRCIEAFSSKFCSGLMNASILYVPFVAVVYATIRGIGKLRRH